MLLRHDVESLDQVGRDAPMNPTGPSIQPRMLVPPLCVVPFGNARLSTAFLARLVLLLPEEASVSGPEVRRDRLVPVVVWNVAPSKLKHLVGSSSNRKTKDVLHKPGNGYPQPQRGSDADTKFVELDGIFLRGGNLGKSFSLYSCGVFFRMARTVLRLTLKVAAMPTWEIP